MRFIIAYGIFHHSQPAPVVAYSFVLHHSCLQYHLIANSFHLAMFLIFACLHYYYQVRDESQPINKNSIPWNRSRSRTLTHVVAHTLVFRQCVCVYVTQENNKQFDLLDSRKFIFAFAIYLDLSTAADIFRFVCLYSTLEFFLNSFCFSSLFVVTFFQYWAIGFCFSSIQFGSIQNILCIHDSIPFVML